MGGRRILRGAGRTCGGVLAVGLLVVLVAARPAGARAAGTAARTSKPTTRTGRTTARISRTAARTGRPGAAAAGICESVSHADLAARLSSDVLAALRGRSSAVGLAVADPGTGVTCRLHPHWNIESASVVKVTILSALLRKLQEERSRLTDQQQQLATEMITVSDNDAASALWAETGRPSLQHFLDLARMQETQLGPGGYWGLTQITAHDELILLGLLTSSNSVLSAASRAYVLNLMAHVVPWQRWGVPAGAPADVTVHVKDGWLPLPAHGWRINSIGSFSGPGRDYMIVVLTWDNPTMTYGVETVEDVAEVINRDLNPGVSSVIPPAAPQQSWGTPDEPVPAPPGRL